MFVVSFEDLKSHALSRFPSGDRVMPRAEIEWRNITVMSHLKFRNSSCTSSLSLPTNETQKCKQLGNDYVWATLSHQNSPPAIFEADFFH